MRLQIEPTAQVMDLDGVPVRIWNGTLEGGDPCLVFVHRVVAWSPDAQAEFDRDLAEVAMPTNLIVEEPPAE
jgi:hypothetical protein